MTDSNNPYKSASDSVYNALAVLHREQAALRAEIATEGHNPTARPDPDIQVYMACNTIRAALIDTLIDRLEGAQQLLDAIVYTYAQETQEGDKIIHMA